MKKTIVFLLCIVCLLPISVHADYDYNSKEFQRVVNQLDMQGHANDELSTCKVKQMYYEEVEGMLNEGMSSTQIINYYVDEYGQAALREPIKNSSGLVAWGMPIIGVLVGISIVILWLRKIRSVKVPNSSKEHQHNWESDLEREIASKMFEEERRKHF